MIRKINKSDIPIINIYIKDIDENEIIDDDIFNHPFSKYIVHVKEKEITGFIKYSTIYERIEIDYVYIKCEYRKNGIAHSLVQYIIDESQLNDIKSISLEVRSSNSGAIKLYEKCGFVKSNIRKKYYGNEDGIIFLKE